jgi:hypothetical protein
MVVRSKIEPGRQCELYGNCGALHAGPLRLSVEERGDTFFVCGSCGSMVRLQAANAGSVRWLRSERCEPALRLP